MRWLPGTRILTWVPATCALGPTLPADRGRRSDGPGPGGPVDRVPTVPRSARRPVQGPATQHVEVEVGHGVEGVGPHVEHQPVAAVLAGDPLGLGHLPGRGEQGGHLVGVALVDRARR